MLAAMAKRKRHSRMEIASKLAQASDLATQGKPQSESTLPMLLQIYCALRQGNAVVLAGSAAARTKKSRRWQPLPQRKVNMRCVVRGNGM
jgi:hypothetical protein